MPPLETLPEDRSTYTTLYVVRHGETEWNIEHRLQGQVDSPLTENGVMQARELGAKFKDIHFDAVFSSDLLRAKRTAELITLEKQMAVQTTQILRERAFGRYEGRLYEEYTRELKHMFDQFEQLAEHEKASFKFADDVESDAELVSRFNTFLREAAVAYQGKTILVVTHGGLIRSLAIHFGFATYQEMKHGGVKNTAYMKLLADGVDYFIEETSGIEK